MPIWYFRYHEVAIDLPRPRDLDAPGHLAARDRVFAIMGMDVHGGGAGEVKSV
jgi:NitT/TauT family transport system ATP-binding protein